MNAENILQTKGNDVFTANVDDTISDAIALLAEHKIGALIVLSSEKAVAGIISERDVVRRLHQSSAAVLHQTVGSCMTANPICGTSEATVDEMMHTMTKNRIRHLPIVDDGQLSGMISIGDVVKRKIVATEEEAAALREYIAS